VALKGTPGPVAWDAGTQASRLAVTAEAEGQRTLQATLATDGGSGGTTDQSVVVDIDR
jgi:hypothetical protein